MGRKEEFGNIYHMDSAHGKIQGKPMLRLLRRTATRWVLWLVLAEYVALVGCVYAAVPLRYLGQPGEWSAVLTGLFPRALFFAAVQVLAVATMGMYMPHQREGWKGQLARIVAAFLGSALGLAVFYYILPPLYIGRGVVFTALILGLLAVLACHSIALRMVDAERLKPRVLVLGAGKRAANVISRMRRRADRRGFQLVGFVGLPGQAIGVSEKMLVEAVEPLPQLARRLRIDEVVVGPDNRRGVLPMEQLLRCRIEGIQVLDLPRFFEREMGKITLDLADPSWLIFSGGFDASTLRQLSKRGFDILIAASLLLLTWPLMLFTVLAIKLESSRGAPVLYRQDRVGLRGKVFQLIKFRSMQVDAEQDGVARWALRNDTRVTRVGRFIRKVRLDELPQLWSVLRGDMSVIGPRPERPEFVAEFSEKIRYYPLRHSVRPGLTGWAQLRYPYGASKEDAEEKLTFDLYYVKNHSLALDLLILIQTVEVVLFGRGAR